VCWAELCPRLAQHQLGFAHLAVFSRLFPFFVVFSIGLLRRFLYPILDPPAFAPISFYSHKISKCCLFQTKAFLNMAFSKTLVYTAPLCSHELGVESVLLVKAAVVTKTS
jgi:hypothetical protein